VVENDKEHARGAKEERQGVELRVRYHLGGFVVMCERGGCRGVVEVGGRNLGRFVRCRKLLWGICAAYGVGLELEFVILVVR